MKEQHPVSGNLGNTASEALHLSMAGQYSHIIGTHKRPCHKKIVGHKTHPRT
jgi:hypothetical protein